MPLVDVFVGKYFYYPTEIVGIKGNYYYLFTTV